MLAPPSPTSVYHQPWHVGLNVPTLTVSITTIAAACASHHCPIVYLYWILASALVFHPLLTLGMKEVVDTILAPT